jgi:hypothetical protein
MPSLKDQELEDFLKAFCDFLNSLEAGVAEMKQHIAELVGLYNERRCKPPAPAGKYRRYNGLRKLGRDGNGQQG